MHNPPAAERNMALGMAYLNHGFTQTAYQKLTKATQQAPDNPKVWDALAYYYEKNGQFTKAEHYYQHAIHLAPSQGAVYTNYGNYLCRRGQYQQAMSAFNQAAHEADYMHPALAYHDAAACAARHGDFKTEDHYNRLAGQA